MELQKEILGLSIAYALLAALLLVIALRARIPWPLKIACVLVTSAYYCVAFFHVEGLPGWSATAPLPPQFQLLWARVVEPNPVDRDPGAVHIWVEDQPPERSTTGLSASLFGSARRQGGSCARRNHEGPSAGRTRSRFRGGQWPARARRSVRCLDVSSRGRAGRRSSRRRSARSIVPDRRVRQHQIRAAAGANSACQGYATP
jgi:hypothetical protein